LDLPLGLRVDENQRAAGEGRDLSDRGSWAFSSFLEFSARKTFNLFAVPPLDGGNGAGIMMFMGGKNRGASLPGLARGNKLRPW